MTEHYNQMQLGKERAYAFRVTVHRGKLRQGLEPGGNLEAKASAEAMEERCVLACSSWLTQPAFL